MVFNISIFENPSIKIHTDIADQCEFSGVLFSASALRRRCARSIDDFDYFSEFQKLPSGEFMVKTSEIMIQFTAVEFTAKSLFSITWWSTSRKYLPKNALTTSQNFILFGISMTSSKVQFRLLFCFWKLFWTNFSTLKKWSGKFLRWQSWAVSIKIRHHFSEKSFTITWRNVEWNLDRWLYSLFGNDRFDLSTK